MRARWNRLIAGAVVVGATALASGCVVFQSGPRASPSSRRSATSSSPSRPARRRLTTCADKGFSDSTAATRALAGARRACGCPRASRFRPASRSNGAGGSRLRRERELRIRAAAALAPAQAGRRWVGYITPTAFTYSDTSGPQTFAVQLPIEAPAGPRRQPLRGRVRGDRDRGGPGRQRARSRPRGRWPAAPPSRQPTMRTQAADANHASPSARTP